MLSFTVDGFLVNRKSEIFGKQPQGGDATQMWRKPNPNWPSRDIIFLYAKEAGTLSSRRCTHTSAACRANLSPTYPNQSSLRSHPSPKWQIWALNLERPLRTDEHSRRTLQLTHLHQWNAQCSARTCCINRRNIDKYFQRLRQNERMRRKPQSEWGIMPNIGEGAGMARLDETTRADVVTAIKSLDW